MIESQLFLDMRALHWMTHNRSPVVDSFARNLSARLKGDQWFQELPKVGSSHSMSQRSILKLFCTLKIPNGLMIIE